MATTNINISIDSELKNKAQSVFEALGLDISTAVNMFIKQVIRNQGFPFLPTTDPFYSKSNMEHLMRVKTDADAGLNMTNHDLIEE